MAAGKPPGTMTVEDWLLADLPEGVHAELVDGSLEMTPLADPPHQIVLFRLNVGFSAYRAGHPEFPLWWSTPGRIAIPGADRGREPDLALYAGEPPLARGPLAWTELRPLLVVEVVSPGQEVRDHVEKRLDYRLAEIPEYWIFDYERRLFLALRRTDRGWDEQQLRGQGTYSTPLLPGFELDLAQLWP